MSIIKKALTCFVFFALVLMMVVTYGQEVSTATELNANVLHLTCSTVMVPSDPICQGLQLFVEKVKEISGGKITADLYHSAQLYPQLEERKALTQGNIDVAVVGMFAFDELPYPGMFVSAYVFTSLDHANRFYNSEWGQKLFDDIAEYVGIRPLGTAYYGSRNINLRKGFNKEVTRPEDMHGVKMRKAADRAWLALGEALGANVVPMAFNEVYLALKTGTIDAQGNALSADKAMGFYEVTGKIILTNHLVWNLHYCINEKLWQSLTEQQKEWIQEAADIAHAYATQKQLEDENKLMEEFKAYGIEFVEPDKDAFIKYARNYYLNNKEVTKDWNWEMYNACQEMAD